MVTDRRATEGRPYGEDGCRRGAAGEASPSPTVEDGRGRGAAGDRRSPPREQRWRGRTVKENGLPHQAAAWFAMTDLGAAGDS